MMKAKKKNDRAKKNSTSFPSSFLSKQHNQEMVKEVDADGSGTVDFSEFLALMSKSVSSVLFCFGWI